MKKAIKSTIIYVCYIILSTHQYTWGAWVDSTKKFHERWVESKMSGLTKEPQDLSRSLQDDKNRFMKDISTLVPLVTSLGKELEPKNILILAYGNDEKLYPRAIFSQTSNPVYQAFQAMFQELQRYLPFSLDRKAKRLAQRQNALRQVQQSQFGIPVRTNQGKNKLPQAQFGFVRFPTERQDSMIISCKIDTDVNQFAQFLSDLNAFFAAPDLSISIVAFGENATIVNQATHFIDFTLDGLVYIQSPIYTYHKGLTGYTEILAQKPTNYAKLINIYTKSFHPVTNIINYPDRKYRAEFAQKQNPSTNKVLNISALKINKQDELAYVDKNDLITADFVLQIPALIREAQNYMLNFDLSAIVLDQTISKENLLASIKEKVNFKNIFVNRFVELKDGNLIIQFGDKGSENYVLLDRKDINQDLLKELSTRYQQELNMSMAQLESVNVKPSDEGRYIRASQIATDLNAVKNRHLEVFKSPLFENYNISDLLNIAPSLLEKLVKDTSLSPQFVANNIIAGGNIAYNLLYLNNNKYQNASQRDYLNAIIALMWYFYGEAIVKNELFTQGAFVIKDTNFAIYNFLMNYVQKVNPTITGTAKDPARTKADNPFAYSRLSSHYKHLKNKYRQYGIDARYDSQSSSLALFPVMSRHLLFGIVDEKNQLIYIKPENYGIYGYAELAHHGVEFGQAQMVKLLPKFKFAFNKEWYGFLEDIIGTDDSEFFRKERIPQDFVRQFLPLVLDYYKQLSTLCEKDIETAIKNHSVGGIKEAIKFNSYLIQLQKELNSSLTHVIDSSKIELINCLVKQSDELVRLIDQQYDHIALRTGREVILDQGELFTSLYYYLLVNQDPQAQAVKQLFKAVLDAKLILRRAQKEPLPAQYYGKLSALSEQLNQVAIEILRPHSPDIYTYIKAVSQVLHNALRFVQKIPNPALRNRYLTPRFGLLSYDRLLSSRSAQ